jgi:periplasmic divalent cation tolerance protein
MQPCILYVTAPDEEVARQLAEKMILGRMCACVNILSAMHSMYLWEGALEHAKEVALIIKTTESSAPSLIEWLVAQHPYDCPCVVQIPITGGNADFLQWIVQNTHNTY